MKVLINAYAVSPSWGSEQGMGWNWIVSIARYCNVFVITEGQWKKEIERALPALTQKDNIHFYYIPVSDRIRTMCWNQGDWRFYFHYRIWQKKALTIAKKIVRDEHIDVIHQLNMIGFREPGFLWRINAIPFIWGPIGGMDFTPMKLMRGEPFSHRIFEMIKNAINYCQINYSIRVRRAISRSSYLIAATKSTYSVLTDKYGKDNVAFINETGTSVFPLSSELDSVNDGNLKMIWVGKFSFRKKLDIALTTLSLLKDSKVHLSIVGTGDETEIGRYHLLAEKLGVQDMVSWYGKIPNDKVSLFMQRSDLLFFTSISDATSTVVLEAISCNLPVLCFNICGFGPLVKDKVGETIEISTPFEAAARFAAKVRMLNENREILQRYSCACDKYKYELSWQWKAERVFGIYKSVDR